jgi:hypothetical protein
MGISWLGASFAGRILGLDGAILLAGDISTFMGSNINMAMSGILAFYFVMNMRK